MQKLWHKNYLLVDEAEAYCFGDNVVLDNLLVKFDALGSIAHAQMLAKIGILSDEEFAELKKGLLAIIKLAKSGKLTVGLGDEDVHTKLENYLTEKLGESGKKLHTGRSRNDQVLVDLKLYSKENLFSIAIASFNLVKGFVAFAKKYEFVPMPGYTHMQKGMPSSVGMWAASFAESLLDDLELCKSTFIYNDQSPLGSAAAYGVPLPLDRELTAKLLGFAKVQNNSLYSQTSRGKSHLAIMSALTQIMMTLSRFAQDLLLFTTSEFNFFTIDENLCTGSSIMPQKKNLDIMEVLRARTQQVLSQQQAVASMVAGLPSGYNADFGETKKPFMEVIETTHESLKLCQLVVKSIKPNIEVLEQACTPEIYTAHSVFKLVEKGLPFRDAYLTLSRSNNNIGIYAKQQVLKEATHAGATGNLGLTEISAAIKKSHEWWQLQRDTYAETISKLLGDEHEK
ncbi:TPA: argininosuccinate lyase [Candidatus Saccharibacteria bacterium]|nr:MAG: Argininosuccinate lyase [Candidatus Saccharibacteria bacterium GW2011_GWA2_46_10]OGL35796.1 MAG: argininosuccinate lyase [Candidatus Saccharibacteria bacterium RIFCSPHIGHO2_12_FULL_47_17]HCM52214.1 argininosuccinate lyase [Candidatus Saccharibacteria bacterium]